MCPSRDKFHSVDISRYHHKAPPRCPHQHCCCGAHGFMLSNKGVVESGWSECGESVTALHGSINYGGSSPALHSPTLDMGLINTDKRSGLCGHLVLVQSTLDTLYTLYTLYTVYFTGPISAKNNTALSAHCTVATAAAALHRHSRTLQPSPVSTHFTLYHRRSYAGTGPTVTEL